MTTEDQIVVALQNLVRYREDLKELKKEKKDKEKKIPEELEELIRAKKEMAAQAKEREEEFIGELQEDGEYNQVREDIVLKEEEIAEEKEKLMKAIAKLKPNMSHTMDVDVDGRPIKLQLEPGMRMFLNGREEK